MRCRLIEVLGLGKLEVSVLGADELALAKLGRGDEGDFDDVAFLLERIRDSRYDRVNTVVTGKRACE